MAWACAQPPDSTFHWTNFHLRGSGKSFGLLCLFCVGKSSVTLEVRERPFSGLATDSVYFSKPFHFISGCGKTFAASESLIAPPFSTILLPFLFSIFLTQPRFKLFQNVIADLSAVFFCDLHNAIRPQRKQFEI